MTLRREPLHRGD